MKKFVPFLLCLVLYSCNSFNGNYKSLNLQEGKPLGDGTVVLNYEADYPVGVYKVNDSIFFIQQAMSDTCFHVLDLSGNRCLYVGNKGYGEDDFLDPNIISSVDKSMLLLEDSDLKKIVKVNIEDDSVYISSYLSYPDVIFVAKELNNSFNYIIGRKVGPYEKMFFIYDKRSGEIIEIDNSPQTPYRFRDNNYTFAPVLSLNEEKGRIVLGMYFWDIVQIYNLEGECIGSYSFQKDYKPYYDRNNKCVDLSKDYSGVIRSFSTNDYCYLLRRSIIDLKSYYSLVQLDWNGKLINHYQLPNNVLGQFYIDDNENQLYIIQRNITESDTEIYSIVSYGL